MLKIMGQHLLNQPTNANFASTKVQTKEMKTFFTLLVSATVCYSASANNGSVLVLEGSYQSKNVYVSNAVSEDGVGFCAYEVRVNGDVTSDEINSSAFEIDLTQFRFSVGDKITIQIIHRAGCEPRVLNPGVLQPLPQFEIAAMDLDQEGMLSWTSTNEGTELPYIVEQYRWNKWVKVGEVASNGTQGNHAYKFKLNLTSGTNKVRLVQRNLNGQSKMSGSVTVNGTEAPVEMSYVSKDKKIQFSRPTSYEVYDAYGQIRKRGYDSTVDMSALEDGDYYLNFDNTNQKIRKR
jgi:hypothetical protein